MLPLRYRAFWNAVRWLIPGAALVAPLAAQDTSPQVEPCLELEEIGVYAVPDSFRLTGVATSPSGDIAFSSDRPAYVKVLDNALRVTAHVPLPTPVSPLALASRADSRLEILVESGDAELRLLSVPLSAPSPPGGVREPSLLWRVERDQTNVLTATAFSDGWFLLFDDGTAFKYVSKGPEEYYAGPMDVDPLRVWSEPVPELTTYVASPGQKGVLLMERDAPHRFVELHGTDIVTSGRPTVALLDEISRERQLPRHFAWISLSIVSLGAGFLQTLSDASSDLRLFLLYDAEGSLLSARVLDAPLGFVAGLPARSQVLAVRGINRAEVVLYQWSVSDNRRERCPL